MNRHRVAGAFSPQDLQLEGEMLCFVENLLTQYIAEGPTSLQEDLALLDNTRSIRHYFAVPFT